jgi:hydroxymethylpyrimidine kinase/phosphomethylpyrimidine kinase
MSTHARALAIGGLDPSAGAGVLLDAFVMARLGFVPCVAVTTVTAQNSATFSGAWPVEPEALLAQLEALAEEGPFACVKVGALGSAALAGVVAVWTERAAPPVVVLDPVLASSSGGSLVADGAAAVGAVAKVATAITPNAEEAGRLAGMPVTGVASAEEAARALAVRYGCDAVVTGLPGAVADTAVDVLVSRDGCAESVEHPLVAGVGDVRGTGCALASALACRLAEGRPIPEALREAHRDVFDLLQLAAPIGRGRQQIDLGRLVSRPH